MHGSVTAMQAVHGVLFINSYKVEINVQKEARFTNAWLCHSHSGGRPRLGRGSRLPWRSPEASGTYGFLWEGS